MYSRCMANASSPIRMQTRAVVRSLLAQTAMRLFFEKGFDGTTVDEVATAAGVSRRTLFNYFKTKEDLALSGLDAQGEGIAERLAARPAQEDPWVSLRQAFEVLEEMDSTAAGRFELISLLFGNDALRAGHAEKLSRWTDLLAPVIEGRLSQSDDRFIASRAIVSAAIVCLRVANEEWIRHQGKVPMLDLFDRAVLAIRTTAPAPAPSA